MVDSIGATRTGTPIGAWMLQGNPARSTVARNIADTELNGEWSWSCHPTYRADLIRTGHPVFFWVTQNEIPSLHAGIWLVGEALGAAEDRPRWNDQLDSPVQPFVELRLSTLRNPIDRMDLLEHPVLQHLEILRVPAMSNPQIITPAQLEALRADFDLTTGPLPEATLRHLLEASAGADLWVAGPDGRDIEVWADDEGYGVWISDEEVAHFDDWRPAFAHASRRAEPDPPITTPPDDFVWVADLSNRDDVIVIARTAKDAYEAFRLDPYDESKVYETGRSFTTLEDALLMLGQAEEDDS